MRYIIQVFASAFKIGRIENNGDHCILYPSGDAPIEFVYVSDTWVMSNNAKVGGYYVYYDNGDSEYVTEDEFNMRATLVDED
ncbi:hypothetical protein [Sphaerochaeta sp. S2]|uniref:hypothetical protein n=1 Tax=Sphaerochaeta sp. S2 TaxID=2798868 RepID=UPI0018E9A755|nr:hypothetical protein [Sphaerochaeta sp. S2]MBJ2356767.1 hypothetical protein [Sphaerochaeta sp. S2]